MVSTDFEGFTLVLLAFRQVSPRLRVALSRTAAGNLGEALEDSNKHRPTILASCLSHADAALGQFELACADAAAVYLRDEIVRHGDIEYLRQLFSELLASPEFGWVQVHVTALPHDQGGLRFASQFLDDVSSLKDLHWPICLTAMLKKARAMASWGEKIGAQVAIGDDGNSASHCGAHPSSGRY